MRQVISRFKRFLSNLGDRNTFVFCCCLIVSIILWWSLDSKNNLKEEFAIPLKLVNVPKDVVITESLPNTFNVTLSAKRNTLVWYKIRNRFSIINFPPVKIDFKKYENNQGHAVIPSEDLIKLLNKELNGALKATDGSNNSIEFYFTYGKAKHFPIFLDKHISAASSFCVSEITSKPDSVLVYAPSGILDTIQVKSFPIVAENLSASLKKNINIRHVKGAKISPENIEVTISIDPIIEKTLEVPIKTVNFPPGKTAKTFPDKVRLIFKVAQKHYKGLSNDKITLTINYEELLHHPNGHVRPTLNFIPDYIIGTPSMKPDSVEFLIEDVTTQE